MTCKCGGKCGGLGATAIEYGLPTSTPIMRDGWSRPRATSGMGDLLEYSGRMRGPRFSTMGIRNRELTITKTHDYLGSLGDDDPTDPIVEAANAPTISNLPSIQVQYDTCLAGKGSFASCNQIPGVTPEMIVAAKAKQIFSSPGSAVSDLLADPKKLAIGAGIIGGLYLLFRKKRR